MSRPDGPQNLNSFLPEQIETTIIHVLRSQEEHNILKWSPFSSNHDNVFQGHSLGV